LESLVFCFQQWLSDFQASTFLTVSKLEIFANKHDHNIYLKKLYLFKNSEIIDGQYPESGTGVFYYFPCFSSVKPENIF